MSVITRGAKNAFRNSIRTLSVVLILALTVGLALVMLLSYQTVQNKIATVKSSIGNTISLSPAGAQGFQGGGEPLTSVQADSVKTIAHVSSVSETMNDRLTAGTDTNLLSAIDPGTLGNRFRNRGTGDTPPAGVGGGSASGSTGATTTRTFTLPVQVTGISTTAPLTQSTVSITTGALFDATKDENVAMVGTGLATKNNLKVGSTFTYGTTTVTVAGIFDSGNQFANAGFYMPLAAVQRLSGQAGQISDAVVTIDSIENVTPAVAAIKAALGTDKVDVVSNIDSATQTLTPLENIKSISLYSLIGALGAGAIITLLTMIMIVRERRKEIGVLKAIGASNVTVVTQFVTESMVLTLLGSVVGIIFGFIFSNPVLNALVNSNTATTASTGGQRGGGVGFRAAQFGGAGIQQSIRTLHAVVNVNIILYGLLAAIVIAILGSAIPAWLIAKVRPAEVMRGE
jgi:putative ABC transport system permease protein